MPLLSIKEREFIPESSKERFLPIDSYGMEMLNDYGVLLSGLSILSKGFWAERPKERDYHILIFTIAGKGVTQTEDGKLFSVSPGEVFICPESSIGHRHAPEADHWEIAWIRLDDNQFWHAIQDTEITIRDFHYGHEIASLMDQMIREHISEDYRSRRLKELFCESFIIYLQRELSSNLPSSLRNANYRLKQLWNTVNADLAHDWNLDNMASHAGMSRTHFIRLCKELYHTTPGDRLREMRMHRAETMLIHLDSPIYMISGTVGYDNPYAFSTAFRKYSGLSPREFRKQKMVQPGNG